MLRSAASPGSRGVRPVGRRYEWPPHDTATDRPPRLRRCAGLRILAATKPSPDTNTPGACQALFLRATRLSMSRKKPALGLDPRMETGFANRTGSHKAIERDDNSKIKSSRSIYLIFPSRNSTWFLTPGSYFFFTSLAVTVREFFRFT